MGCRVLDKSGSASVQVAGSCRNSSKAALTIKCTEFHTLLRNYRHLNNSTPWSYAAN